MERTSKYVDEVKEAVDQGIEKVVELLDGGFDINSKRCSYSLLLRAAKDGKTDIVKLLLDRGADIDIKENYSTAVYIATMENHEETVKLLLDRGAKITVKSEANRIDENILHLAARQGNDALVRLFLERNIADINAETSGGETALSLAASRGRVPLVKILLDHGGNSDNSISHALVRACSSRHIGVVKFLLERGAIQKLSDQHTGEVLRGIITTGCSSVFRLLLDYGINVDATVEEIVGNYRGKTTALHLALSQGNEEEYNIDGFLESDPNCHDIIEQMLDHGVTIDIVVNKDDIEMEIWTDSESNSDSSSDEIEDKSKFTHRHAIDFAMDGERANEEKMFLLLAYGIDVNLEIKGIYGRGLSLMHEALDQEEYFDLPNVGSRPSCKVRSQMITQYLVKLISEGSFVSRNNLKWIDKIEDLRDYRKLCEEEIEKMKKTPIGDSAIFYYDLFSTKNLNQLAGYARSEIILREFQTKVHKGAFPIYWKSLAYQLKRGIWRKLLLLKVQRFFHAVADTEDNRGLAKLPCVCIAEIFSHLRNRDLRTLMLVCRAKLDVDIYDIDLSDSYFQTEPKAYDSFIQYFLEQIRTRI